MTADAERRLERPLLAVLVLSAVGLGCTCGSSKPPEKAPPPSGLEAIRQMLALPEDKIDLAKAKLTIDQMVDPATDVRATMAQLDSIARSVASRLPADANSRTKVEALRAQIYEAGPWNENRPFSYDLDDPFGRTLRNKLLATYLATRKGNCISMPMLFIVVGQKLGLDVTATTAPEHVLVKYRDEAGSLYNLETTSGAGFTSDGWIKSQIPMSEESLNNGLYLRRLSKRETVAVMLGTLMEHYGREGRHEDRLALARLALEHAPKDISAMMQVHAAYGGMIQRDFRARYSSPRDIPMEQRARYIELNREGQAWLQKSEALGWREPTQEQVQRYKQTVDGVKSGH